MGIFTFKIGYKYNMGILFKGKIYLFMGFIVVPHRKETGNYV